MKGRRGKLHIFKFYSVRFPLNIIRIIKSRRLRWMGNVTCMGCNECIKRLIGKAKGKRSLEGYIRDKDFRVNCKYVV
jgi:hypothetical protein